MKPKKLIVATALAMGLMSGAQAVMFDPDGNPLTLNTIDVGTLDWGPTGLLALGGSQAIRNTVLGTCPVGGCTFDLLTHARLIGTLSPAGPPNTPAGLNTTFEITMIARFTEVVTGVVTAAGIATFASVTSAPGFLEILFDSSPDAVDVSGSGFNDGNVILRGTSVGASSGLFQVTSTTGVPLDGSPDGNQYTGQLTVQGTGSNGNIPIDSLITDPAFFLQALTQFGISFANISQGLPYIAVTPSDCYTGAASTAAVVGGATAPTTPPGTGCNTAHVDGLMAANILPAPPAPGIVPDIDTINGLFTGSRPDFVAQTDYNSPLQGVPEPGILALLGVGLSALAFRRRAQRGA